MNKHENEKTRVDFLIRFFKNNKFTAFVIVIGIALIAIGNVTQSGDQLLRTIGFLKTYDVNQATERGRFSSALIENAWNRLFWMRNYTEKIKKRAPKDELDRSWQKLMDATEKWSSNIMNYYIGLDEYYPEGKKRDILEFVIQPSLNSVMVSTVNLKYNLSKLDSISIQASVKTIQDSVDMVNNELYRLVDQPLQKRSR